MFCKGTVFSNLSLNFFLTERAIKNSSIYSLDISEEQQLTFLCFSFLHAGNTPSFIMWNGMPHDFSKCTSNVCLSANLGFNNGKSPEKRIFAAGACLPKQSPYHWVEIRGRFVDGEWSSHFPKHFGKLTLGLCLLEGTQAARKRGGSAICSFSPPLSWPDQGKIQAGTNPRKTGEISVQLDQSPWSGWWCNHISATASSKEEVRTGEK